MTNEYGIYRAQIQFPFQIASKRLIPIAKERREQPVEIYIDADKVDYWKRWFDVLTGVVEPESMKHWSKYQRKITLTIELEKAFPQEIKPTYLNDKHRHLTLITDNIEVVDVKIEGYEK